MGNRGILWHLAAEHLRGNVTRTFLSLAVGLAIKLSFFVTFLNLIAFMDNLFVPKSVDVEPTVAPSLAALIDLGLIVLFGLHQLWCYMRGTPEPKPPFVQPLFCRAVRRPLYLGFIIVFWAVLVMTLGHLLFSAGMTAYIFVGIPYEERDLLAAVGAPYAEYRRKVGMLIPGIGKVRG
jgi:protein-S-isoprenylcysteine O-methyltransferase Ste14